MYLLQYLFKFSVSLALVYNFYRVVLRPLTFYQWNRFYLLCYALLSFIIPFVNVTPWILKKGAGSNQLVNLIPVIGNYTATAKPVAVHVSLLQSINWIQCGFVCFCVGAAVMLARLAYQYLSLLRIRHTAIPVNSKDAVRLYQTTAPISPFSFGNAIYFNSSRHTEEELQRIILHEFVHVRQQHSADIILGELLCVVNWFNPFAWLIRQAIRQNLEFIADDAVVTNGLNKKEYQYLLLKVVGLSQYSFVTNFNFSGLKKRIAMMNKMKSAKLHLAKFLFVLPLLAVLLLAFRNKINADDYPRYAVSLYDLRSSKTMNSEHLLNALTDTIPVPPAQPVSLPPPPPPPAGGNVPARVTITDTKASGSANTVTVTLNTVTVTLQNGQKEVYNLNDPKQKVAYTKKYGKLAKAVAPPVPVAPVQGSDTLPAPPAPPAEAKLQPLYVLDKRELAGDYDMNKVDPNDIERIVVLKGKQATDKYGDKAKNGVVEITTKPPMVVLDSVVQPAAFSIKDLNPQNIESVNVLTNQAAVDRYGEQAKHGVLIVTTKHRAKNRLPDNILIILDGKEQPAGTDIDSMVKPDDIDSMNVLNGQQAFIKYGEKAKNGAIEITTKLKRGKANAN